MSFAKGDVETAVFSCNQLNDHFQMITSIVAKLLHLPSGLLYGATAGKT